jgi:hypothetical protein
MPSITALIDACVSPYVNGRGGASAVPTTPSCPEAHARRIPQQLARK